MSDTQTGKDLISSNQSSDLSTQSPLLTPQFDAMIRLAECMCLSKTVPAFLHNSPADCLRIIELAARIGVSPFMLADGAYFVSGKLALDGKTIAALINSSSYISGSLRYTYNGEGSERSLDVSGTIRGESEPRVITVTLAQGMRDSGGARERWKNDPDQMLVYYGARVWARRHAPEIIMGLYTPDELNSVIIDAPAVERKTDFRAVKTSKETEKKEILLLAAVNDAKSSAELAKIVPEIQTCSATFRDSIRVPFKKKSDEIKASEVLEKEEELLKQQEQMLKDDLVNEAMELSEQVLNLDPRFGS